MKRRREAAMSDLLQLTARMVRSEGACAETHPVEHHHDDAYHETAIALNMIRTRLVALDEASMTKSCRIVNKTFEWDFWVKSCRACGGDFPVPNMGVMPVGWTNRGHQPGCWFAG